MAPQLAQAAVQRARLRLVPRPVVRSRAAKVPFVVLISAILLAGVVGLLLFNTSMQQASFKATALERQATDLSARQEALEMSLAQLRNPQRVAGRAQQMGMVIPTEPTGMLDLSTGRIEGTPRAAQQGDRLPLSQPGPRRPAVLDPR
jgi:cell division protein FtsL